ncbi:hypothetical protein WJX79_007345 [Trebouxia sp. C0005]
MTYRYVANIRLAGNALFGCGLVEDKLPQVHSASVESESVSHRQFSSVHNLISPPNDGVMSSTMPPSLKDYIAACDPLQKPEPWRLLGNSVSSSSLWLTEQMGNEEELE